MVDPRETMELNGQASSPDRSEAEDPGRTLPMGLATVFMC